MEITEGLLSDSPAVFNYYPHVKIVPQLTLIAVSHRFSAPKVTSRRIFSWTRQQDGPFIEFFGEKRMLQASNLYWQPYCWRTWVLSPDFCPIGRLHASKKYAPASLNQSVAFLIRLSQVKQSKKRFFDKKKIK